MLSNNVNPGGRGGVGGGQLVGPGGMPQNPMQMMQDMMQAQSRMMQSMTQMMFGGADPFSDMMGMMGGMGGGFGSMGAMSAFGSMPDISGMMTNAGSNGGAMMYSSQQVFNSGDPSQCYTRTSATSIGPGGVVESRVSERDGRDGVERVGIRRQVGDQIQQIERERDLATGEENTRTMTHGIDNPDSFETEFQERRRAPATWGTRAAQREEPLAIADRPAIQPSVQIPVYSSSSASSPQQPAYQPTSSSYTSAQPSYSPTHIAGRNGGASSSSVRSERSTEVPPGYPPGTRVYYREVSSPQAGAGATGQSSSSASVTSASHRPAQAQSYQPQAQSQTTRQPRHHSDGSYW